MMSYRELLKNRKNEETQNKEAEDTKRKLDKEFAEVREKAFLDMLHGNKNINPKRFFSVNDHILLNYKQFNIKYLHDQTAQAPEGWIYFIETQEGLMVKLIREKRSIEYSVRIIDLNDSFIVYIQGFIKVNDAKEEFYINEPYLNSQFSNVVNAYNLKKLIDLFNDLGRDDPANNNPNGNNGSSDIDDFLSGKIE
jgi:hypothetical protein